MNMPAAARTFREADVCVLGGGPAGSTISTRLRALGYSVCLIEQKNTRKTHAAATLPPQILPMLQCIEARERVEQEGFADASQTWLWWTTPAPEMREHAGALHVERSRFSQLLLQSALEAGVSVFHSKQMSPPERMKDVWEVSLEHGEVDTCIRSRFLVDATGTANPLRERRTGLTPSLLGIVGTWRVDPCASFPARIEAGHEEWFWAAPASPGVAIAAVFLDPGRLRGASDLTDYYCERLRTFRLFAEHQQRDRLTGVHACDAGFRRAASLCGPDFIRVGDAAATLDPLSSQGVLSAVASALQAAAVVNTLLRKPPHAGDAIEFYTNRQRERVDRCVTKAAEFYRERAGISPTPFWLDRAGDEPRISPPAPPPLPDLHTRVALAPNASLETGSVSSGDLILLARVVRFGEPPQSVAFLGGREVAPLLEKLRGAPTLAGLLDAWEMSRDNGLVFFKWFWDRQIIRAVD